MRWLIFAVCMVSLSLAANAEEDATYVKSAILKGARECSHDGPILGSDAAPKDLLAARKKNYDLLLGGHCIGPGDGVVIHYSEFDKGSDVDSGRFRQLTIYVPQADLRRGSLLKANSDFRLYYSDGGSVWIQQGHGVYGTFSQGKLFVRAAANSEVTLDIDLEIDVRFANQPLQDIRHISIHRNFREIDLSRLQMCLGMSAFCPR